jgi:hypothetical protein
MVDLFFWILIHFDYLGKSMKGIFRVRGGKIGEVKQLKAQIDNGTYLFLFFLFCAFTNLFFVNFHYFRRTV